MKKEITLVLLALCPLVAGAQDRWEETRQGDAFFGVNYTLPFAHAYRALGYLGLDRKTAIDKDTYHFARLGLNAYRIHLWDVELTDSLGNLTPNDHLDLMDYLIHKLEERGIHIVLTAQTNFGNGYPERDRATGGFSYLYDKCDVHANPRAVAAQERYLGQLLRHVNPYTGKAYNADPAIVGFEVNNEPCHAGTRKEVTAYINRMVRAMRATGYRGPVFYNVSHNQQVVEAYYDANIQGTTYQWYPIGLVAGHTRQGNYLTAVDSYPIPFADRVKNFDRQERLVYEFSPADVLYSHLYPAMTRSFRTAGFRWITQFAYDPIDIAYANTEYQTHFLNLAYTPGKAISLRVAAEAARAIPMGTSYGTYPRDTLFADGFRVSYAEDLSELNNGVKFYHSNHTATRPADAARLESVAGCGSSPIVDYEGTGAYFIDRLEPGVWRLEVMPDAVVVSDPFAKPSPRKDVVDIVYGTWDMTLRLPDLGDTFSVHPLDQAHIALTAKDGTIGALRPGVYLLRRSGATPSRQWTADSRWQHIRLGEFVAPAPRASAYRVVHKAAPYAETGQALTVRATVAGPARPDSVTLYPGHVSFWNARNPIRRMRRVGGYTYETTIPASELHEGLYGYNIVICRGDSTYTFPSENSDAACGYASGFAGTPLDWDYTSTARWSTRVVAPASPVALLTAAETERGDAMETYQMPEWGAKNADLYLRAWIKNKVESRKRRTSTATTLCLRPATGTSLPAIGMSAGFVTSDGYTYNAPCPAPGADGIVRLPLTALRQTDTALLPHAYPTFLPRTFHPTTDITFEAGKAERLEIRLTASGETPVTPARIAEAWLE
ncbi:MAG: hypothetical protein LBN29_08250 [Mediterranea sp.]|jgi:hypothetical protein|nr:hypothetical protein [Mediterranea sp.]